MPGVRQLTGTRRLAVALAAIVLAGLAAWSMSTAAASTVTYESQAWWRREGIQVPGAVGAHVHTKVTIPADGRAVDGRVDIPVTITLHDARGSTSWFRIGTEDQELYKRDVEIGPCHDCSTSFVATVDFGKVPSGRHEIRVTTNNPDEDPTRSGEQRMFQSTGYQVCVRSCSPSYRSGQTHIESRGWYTDSGYQNARLDTEPADIRAGAVVDVWFGAGAGGGNTALSGVYIDPDFHGGSVGIRVREVHGAFDGSVTIPSLSPGAHKLVLVSSDGQNAGVLVVPFTQPSGTGPAPTATPKPTASPTPRPSPSPTPTTAPTATPTAAPTATPTASPTATADGGPPTSPTPGSTPTATPDPTPTATPRPTPTPEATIRTTTVNDTSSAFDWTGRWATARHSGYHGGGVHWTTTRGAKATLVFTGTKVSWIGPTGPTRGKARVYIDGRLRATIDLYSSRFRARRVVYSVRVPDGRHRISIVAQGTAGRPYVAIDAIQVTGPG